MKRLYTTPKWKRHQKSKNNKTLRRRASLNARRKRKKISSRVTASRKLTPKNPNQFKVLPSPIDFSLVKNTEKVLSYFNYAQDILHNKNQIIFDISKVETLTPDGITLLIAKLNDPKFHKGIRIIGNAPVNPQLRNIFIQSGFYEYVNSKMPKIHGESNLLLHKETNNKVEPKIAKEACLIGIKNTFHNEEIYEPLYDILIEAMQNTNNHAGARRGIYDWWLYVFSNPETRITSYSFLDLGVGIFESLPVRNWKRNFLTQFFKLTSNLDLIDKLLAGEISSRTGKAERGKGIPQIYQCSKDKNIREFIIISNDVYADLKNQEYQEITTTFEGTFLYWEIQP